MHVRHIHKLAVSDEHTTRDMSKESTITMNTKVTLATIAVAVAAITPGVVVWYKVDSMQSEMRQTWSLQQQVLWSERLGAANPSIVVPRAEEVFLLVNRKR